MRVAAKTYKHRSIMNYNTRSLAVSLNKDTKTNNSLIRKDSYMRVEITKTAILPPFNHELKNLTLLFVPGLTVTVAVVLVQS